MKPLPDEYLPGNIIEAINDVCNNSKLIHYGLMELGLPIVHLKNEEGCDIQILNSENTMASINLVMAFRKGSSYRKVIDHEYVQLTLKNSFTIEASTKRLFSFRIHKMKHRGVAKRLHRRYWPGMGMPKTPDVPGTEAIKLVHIAFIYCIMLGGHLLSALFLVYEKVYPSTGDKSK